jgi:hypothetical protein
VCELRPDVLCDVVRVRNYDDFLSLTSDHEAMTVAASLEVLDAGVQEVSQTLRAGLVEDCSDGVVEARARLPDDLIVILSEGHVIDQMHLAHRGQGWKRRNVAHVELARDCVVRVLTVWFSALFVLELLEQVIVLL